MNESGHGSAHRVPSIGFNDGKMEQKEETEGDHCKLARPSAKPIIRTGRAQSACLSAGLLVYWS